MGKNPFIECMEMPYNLIPVIIVGPESWKSFGILNPNAFSSDLKPDVMACADKLALISYSIQIIQKEIDRDVNKFIKELNYGDAFKDFIPDLQKPTIVIYHNMSFQAGLQSFFIATKSMLDIYARIISKAIKPGSRLFGFNKAKVGGKKVVGGSLLNFINQNAPKSYADKEKLIGILSSHIDNWISDVVKFRDKIVHEGQLTDLMKMCVPLSKKPQTIIKDEITLPTIRDKGNVLEYCQLIQKNINRMLKETLVLLPNVNTKLIAL